MSSKIVLTVTEGPIMGKSFTFEEHDTFIFGRGSKCHMKMPKDDKYVSRYHFILEVNPPQLRVRDLGSMNGTHVNGTKHGGRGKGESPEQGRKKKFPEVDLENGDIIRVGKTSFKVDIVIAPSTKFASPKVVRDMRPTESIATVADCCVCGLHIPKSKRKECDWPGGKFICPPCRKKEEKFMEKLRESRKSTGGGCLSCGEKVEMESWEEELEFLVCENCLTVAKDDPLNLFKSILIDAGLKRKEKKPEIILKMNTFDVDAKPVGVGGFGATYRARSKVKGNEFALKLMLSQIPVYDNMRETFHREIEILVGMEHPNVAKITDFGSLGPAFYFFRDFLAGVGLDVLLKNNGGKLKVEEALPLVLDICEGIAFLHHKNICHRDLKPPNVLVVQEQGRSNAVLLDVGISKSFEKTGFSGMTLTQAVASDLGFTPREQVTNFKHVTPVSDVWSIGALFYHLLTGMCPRDFQPDQDPLDAILNNEVVPIQNRGVQIPEPIAKVINRALSENLEDRYRNASELKEAITNCK